MALYAKFQYRVFQLTESLLEDALTLLSRSLSRSQLDTFPTNLSCQKTNHWAKGSELADAMKQVGTFGYKNGGKMSF